MKPGKGPRKPLVTIQEREAVLHALQKANLGHLVEAAKRGLEFGAVSVERSKGRKLICEAITSAFEGVPIPFSSHDFGGLTSATLEMRVEVSDKENSLVVVSVK